MSYATNADAPSDVRDRFKGHCLWIWRTTWNDTFDRHGDEGRAFATAEMAAKSCMEAGAMGHPDKAIKFVKDDPDMIEGLAIPFGGPLTGGRDLDGEMFSKDTDLCLDWFSERPVLYHHGTDDAVKTSVIGRQVQAEVTDDGVWVRAQLDKNHRYRAAVGKLIEQDALAFSSGAMPHLVKVGKSGHIDRWPWVELSATPTADNPTAVIYAVKSSDVLLHLASIMEVPESLSALVTALDDGAATKSGLEHGSYTEHGQRVLADLSAFVQRTGERAISRDKVGRVLSAANRDLLTSYLGQLDALAASSDEIRRLLRETDPEAAKSATAVLAEFAAIEARIAGVIV